MFVSDALVYAEMHKTACSHIGKLLRHCLQGEQIGKHNRIPADLQSRFVLGSIRNPWDWYVSLWGYGCDAKGSVYAQTGRKLHWPYYRHQLPNEMGLPAFSWGYTARQAWHDLSIPVERWREVYSDSRDVEGFRRWLKLVFDPERALDVGEGYGFSALSSEAGLMSYRFFKLFSSIDQKMYQSGVDASLPGLQQLWEQHGFVDFFIRQEQLSDDFYQALDKAEVELDQQKQQQLAEMVNTKTNISSRSSASDYYDDESVALVAKREAFIIDKFNYQPPEGCAL